jgi:hypothetical protein
MGHLVYKNHLLQRGTADALEESYPTLGRPVTFFHPLIKTLK